MRQAKLVTIQPVKVGPSREERPLGSECCVVTGDSGCEAYTEYMRRDCVLILLSKLACGNSMMTETLWLKIRKCLLKLTPMAWRYVLISIVFAVAIALGFGIIRASSGGLADPSKVLGSLVWATLIVIAILFFEESVRAILGSLKTRIENAERFELGKTGIVIQGIQRIPIPDNTQAVTLENVALLHTSFARPDKTQKFNDGMEYFQIEVIVLAPAQVLDRVQKVTYYLDPTYPKPVQEVFDRATRFKLKELANGTSIVRAVIDLKGQTDPLQLNRFIDLRPIGPRI